MKEKIILYTTHCPMCSVLERKLKVKNIQYIECTDIDEMMSLEFMSVPILKVGDIIMDFYKAIKWVNSYSGDKEN